jgi:hypothetical protein
MTIGYIQNVKQMTIGQGPLGRSNTRISRCKTGSLQNLEVKKHGWCRQKHGLTRQGMALSGRPLSHVSVGPHLAMDGKRNIGIADEWPMIHPANDWPDGSGHLTPARSLRPDRSRGFAENLLPYRLAHGKRFEYLEILLHVGNARTRPIRTEQSFVGDLVEPRKILWQ